VGSQKAARKFLLITAGGMMTAVRNTNRKFIPNLWYAMNLLEIT